MPSLSDLWRDHSAVVVVVVLVMVFILAGWMGYLPGCVNDFRRAKNRVTHYHPSLGPGGLAPPGPAPAPTPAPAPAPTPVPI